MRCKLIKRRKVARTLQQPTWWKRHKLLSTRRNLGRAGDAPPPRFLCPFLHAPAFDAALTATPESSRPPPKVPRPNTSTPMNTSKCRSPAYAKAGRRRGCRKHVREANRYINGRQHSTPGRTSARTSRGVSQVHV